MPDFITQLSTAAAIILMIYGFCRLSGRLLIGVGDYLDSYQAAEDARDVHYSGDV